MDIRTRSLKELTRYIRSFTDNTPGLLDKCKIAIQILPFLRDDKTKIQEIIHHMHDIFTGSGLPNEDATQLTNDLIDIRIRHIMTGIVPWVAEQMIESILLYISEQGTTSDSTKTRIQKAIRTQSHKTVISKMVEIANRRGYEEIWKDRCDIKGQWEQEHQITEEMKRTIYFRPPNTTPTATLPYRKRKANATAILDEEHKHIRLKKKDPDFMINPRCKFKMKGPATVPLGNDKALVHVAQEETTETRKRRREELEGTVARKRREAIRPP
jgi:hypothetical protein